MKFAIYDLSTMPASYDVVTFLIIAKSKAAALGEYCHIIFKKGPNKGFRSPNKKKYSLEEQEFRLRHVLYPACSSLGMDYSTDLFSDLPPDDIIEMPHPSLIYILEQYKAAPLFWPDSTPRAKELIKQHFPEPPITITLRECYSEERNSHIQDWLKFADYVYSGYDIVFVRDTQKYSDDLQDNFDMNYPTFPPASIDFDLRLALYQYSKLNMTVGGGPSVLLYYSTEIPYLTFKMAVNRYGSSHEDFLAKMGMPVGSQFPWCTQMQKIVWAEDTFENLKQEYDKWVDASAAA